MAKDFCLLPHKVDEFKKALKDKDIKIVDLINMSSDERIALLRNYAGDSAPEVNLLFEQKLVLKNKMRGLTNLFSKLTETGKYSPEKKAELEAAKEAFKEMQQKRILSPAEEESFLESLAEKQLGTEVTEEMTKNVYDLTMKVKEMKAKMNDDFTFPTEADRLNYGAAEIALENYLKEIRGTREYGFVNPLAEKGIASKIIATLENIRPTFKFIADNTRGLVASVDNSLWGNQGLRVAFDPRYNKIWRKNFLKSFVDFGKTIVKGNDAGDAILDATKAEVLSRPNALKGLYQNKGGRKLDITGSEEEFPTSLPSRLGEIPVVKNIPVLKQLFSFAGRVYKASEVTYEAGAMRLRADVADKMYSMAEKLDLDMEDPDIIGSYNTLANSLTGRGFIGRGSEIADVTNSAFFSVRFFKSNFDFLTAHLFDSKVNKAAKVEALKNILMVLSTTAIFLGINKELSTDEAYNPFDPRSSDFGKLKIGNSRINIAPYASLAVVIAKIVTQSYRSTTTGEIKPLNERDKKGNPKYGAPTGMDVFWDFTENKFSPMLSLLRDQIRQQRFDRSKPTTETVLEDATTPMSVSTTKDLLEDKDSDKFLDFLLTAINTLGFGVNTYKPDEKEDKK